MADEEWPSDWLRAVLTMAVLSSLADQDSHGYAILQRLREQGLGEIKGSTLYPLLARQQEAEVVDHRWEHEGSGPARKVFHLTDKGRAEVETLTSRWRAFDRVVERMLQPNESGDQR